MKVLITGAFGFVGKNLSAYLTEKGFELWALDVDSPGSGQSAIGNGQAVDTEEFFHQDAKTQRGNYARRFNWNGLERIPWGEVDAVIHLAGKAHDTCNASDPQSYFDVNVGLTEKVLQAVVGSWQSASGNGDCPRQDAKDRRKESDTPTLFQHPSIPVKRFILFSSVKAVADRVEGVLTEDAEPNPQTPYGKSKLEAERVVRSAVGSRRLAEGEKTANLANGVAQSAVRYYILRPCMIHGPGNKGNLNLLYGVVRKGIPWPLGAFENRRSFTSIGNLCAVIEALLEGDVPSGVYQMADDEALSTNELIGLMAESLERRVRIWRIPARWVKAGARLGDILRLPLNSERLKKLTESYVASNARLKEALGWERMPVRAEEGMRKTLESFSHHGATAPRR